MIIYHNFASLASGPGSYQAVSTVSGKVSPFVSLESLSIIKKWDDDDDDDGFPVPSLKPGMMRSTSKVAQNVAPGLWSRPLQLPLRCYRWHRWMGEMNRAWVNFFESLRSKIKCHCLAGKSPLDDVGNYWSISISNTESTSLLLASNVQKRQPWTLPQFLECDLFAYMCLSENGVPRSFPRSKVTHNCLYIIYI